MRVNLRTLRTQDDGVSLVEIVVAMIILALIAVAFLPMLISGLKVSESDSSLTTATELVSEQVNLARSKLATCAAITTFATPSIDATTVTDGSGKVLTTTRSVTCPSSYPGTALFTASVTAAGSSTPEATASTRIYVSSAS